eukprot:jgi/Hompol1/4947/HPOL_004047-RA
MESETKNDSLQARTARQRRRQQHQEQQEQPLHNHSPAKPAPKPKPKSKPKTQIHSHSNSQVEHEQEPEQDLDPEIQSLLVAYQRLLAGRVGPKKTLVLDLDETLIHSAMGGSRRHDFAVEVLMDKHICLYFVYKRPYVDLFLKKAAEWFKIVIFTASVPEYADPVIDWLDPNRTIVSKRYFRRSCTVHNGVLVKDLSVVEQDLSQVILIDNCPFSYSLNEDNGIPIDTWTGDNSDERLLDLLPFLDALRFTEDVRSILSLKM